MLPVRVLSAPTQLRARANAVTLGLASLGFVSLGLPEGSLGVAWPSIRAAFDLPLDALGLLLTTFASGYVVSSAISGRVLARFGIGTVLAASCALTGLSLLGYAVAPAWPTLVGLSGALGIGAGTIDAGLNTYAAVQHGSRVLNWMHAAFGLGAAVGPLLMTAIIGSGLGWNVGYAVVGVLQLGLAAGYVSTRHRFGGATGAHRDHARGGPAAAVHTDTPNGASAAQRSPDKPGATVLAAKPQAALWRSPLMWVSAALFFVYAGIEVSAGQWSFSLFTLARDLPPAVAGVLISTYWGSLTVGRLVFGAIAPRVSNDRLLRACMLVTLLAAGLLWLNLPVLSGMALAGLGLVLAPVFPVLIAETPSRLGLSRTADAVGLQVAAAVLGGAGLSASVGILAARLGLEVVGGCLFAAGLVQLLLHEILLRRASARPQSARSRSSEVASFPPGA